MKEKKLTSVGTAREEANRATASQDTSHDPGASPPPSLGSFCHSSGLISTRVIPNDL